MIRTILPRLLRLHLSLLVLTICTALSSGIAWATNVSPMSLSDTVRSADAIVSGTVTGHQSRWGDSTKRWMETDYYLEVEEVIYPSEAGVPITKTIKLTYWGGTIGGETQTISDMRLPVDGERVVVMLQPGWTTRTGFTPTVGFNQGLFSATTDPTTGAAAMVDGEGARVVAAPDGKGIAKAPAGGAGGASLGLDTFTAWLRANVSTIKRSPVPPKPQVDPADPRLMKVMALAPEPVVAAVPGVPSSAPASVAPRQEVFSEAAPPSPDGGVEPTVPEDSLVANRDIVQFSSTHVAHLPIIVNQLPASFTPWSPEDQYQMSKWNYYGSDVFRVFITPTGSYGWGNSRFDLAGWPPDADLQNIYGATWYCGANCVTLGVTFLRYDDSGFISEADIALNPHVGWTLDDAAVLDGSTLKGFRQTMIHELGHMHGLNHNFGFLALMNYMQPSKYRFFAMPYMDDAVGIRAEYPSNAVSLTDLAVYLYRETGTCFDGTSFYNCIEDATYPASVKTSGILTVNNYHVENSGTTTITTPTIEWYLTGARSASSAFYLGTTSYSPSLPPFTYFTPGSVSRSFTVPAQVPAGQYYLLAYIRNDTGPSQPSFPFNNNYGFSRTKITVTDGTPPTGTIRINGGAGVTKQATVSLTLSATDISGVSQMCIGNTSTCSVWETYVTSKSWILPAGNGQKTVYARFKDTKGNISAAQTATIYLDMTAPTNGTLTATPGPGQISLNWSGFGDNLGISKYVLRYAIGSAPLSCSSGTAIPGFNGAGLSFTHTSLTNATYGYRLCAQDTAGNLSTGVTKTAIPLPAESDPPAGAIAINAGALATKSSTVTLTLPVADASGVAQMCLSNTATCTTWQPYAASKSWTLAYGSGLRGVYAWFKDVWGNKNTLPVFGSIIVDPVPPLNGSVTVTPGPGSITLNWSGFTDALTGVAGYKVVFGIGTAPASCSVGIPVPGYDGTSTSYTQNGLPKNTYAYRVCAIDVAGNLSTGVTKTAVPLPTESNPPAGSIVINKGAAATKSAIVSLDLPAADVSGVAQMCISNTTSCTAWQPYAATKSWTLSYGNGVKTAYVWFRDAWGNQNPSPYFDSIVVDPTAPLNGTVTVSTAPTQVTLNWSGFSDALSGLAGYKVVYALGYAPTSCSTGTAVPLYNGTATSYVHTGLNAQLYGYRVCAVDLAGNVSTGVAKTAIPK